MSRTGSRDQVLDLVLIDSMTSKAFGLEGGEDAVGKKFGGFADRVVCGHPAGQEAPRARPVRTGRGHHHLAGRGWLIVFFTELNL